MAWTNDPTNTPSTGLSAVPPNGGSGFQAWTSSKTASIGTGYFLGNAAALGYANLNSADNTAFAMYGHMGGGGGSGNSTFAFRKPINPLMDNGIISLKIGVNFRNGYKGVQFLNAGNPVFTFTVYSNLYRYRFGGAYDYQNTTGYNTWASLAYQSNSVFNFIYTKISSSFATIDMSRTSSDPSSPEELATFNSSAAINKTVDEIRFFVDSADNSLEANNLYFNFLSAYNAYR